MYDINQHTRKLINKTTLAISKKKTLSLWTKIATNKMEIRTAAREN